MKKLRPLFDYKTRKRADLPGGLAMYRSGGKIEIDGGLYKRETSIFQMPLTRSFRDEAFHYVFDRWCMPADVYLYLVAKGVREHFKRYTYELKDVCFTSPLLCDEDIDYIVEVKLTEDYGILKLEICSRMVDEPEITSHMRCNLELMNSGEGLGSLNYILDDDISVFDKRIFEKFDGADSAIKIGGIYRDKGTIGYKAGLYESNLDLLCIENLDQNYRLIPIFGKVFSGPIYTSENSVAHNSHSQALLPFKIGRLILNEQFRGNNFIYNWITTSHPSGDSTSSEIRMRDELGRTVLAIEGLNVGVVDRFRFLGKLPEKSKSISSCNIRRKEGRVNEGKNTQGNMDQKELAIIGIAGVFPQASSIYELWGNLITGANSITEVPENRWKEFDSWYDCTKSQKRKAYTRMGGFIDNIDKFDYKYFSLTKADAELMDPQQRIMLQEAIKAIKNAGIEDAYLKQHRCGVFVGCAKGDYERVLEKCGLDLDGKSFTGNSASLIAANIAYYLDLKGPAYTVDTACSSSLTAVHVAAESISRGECDLAVVGGVNIFSSPTALIHTTQVGMQSKAGYCRTFDKRADGTVFSEACAAVVIKSLSRAISDNDPIYAVIAGTAINQDGKTNGITAPNSQSQTELIMQALKKANISSSEIKYVEAHGTATPLGDPIEVHALAAAYSDYDCSNGRCLIGSIKSNIGHSGYCAGLVGLIKCALSVKYNKIPATINYSQPNTNIAFERTPFEVNTKLSEWPQSGGGTKYCAVSAFGFGGSNAHVILRGFENAIAHSTLVANRNAQSAKYILLSGKELTHLARNVDALLQYLLFCTKNGVVDIERELNIENIAYTLELTRTHYSHRIGILVDSISQLEHYLTKISCDATLCTSGTIVNGASEELYRTSSSLRVDKSKYEDGKKRYRRVLAEQWLRNGETAGQLLNDYSPTARRICLPGYVFFDTKVWPDCSARISERHIPPVRGSSLQYPAENNENSGITIAGLIDILAEISKLEASEIRPEMSIADIGIDSINIRKLSYSLQERFGVIFNLGRVYACKDIEEVWKQLVEDNIILNGAGTGRGEHCRNEHSVASHKEDGRDSIAIIGYSFCLPGANNDNDLWKILMRGEAVTASVEFSITTSEYSYHNAFPGANTGPLFAGLIDDKYFFDYEFFGINESEAVHICPQHRQLLQHTYAAIENAGINIDELAGRRVGVFVAVGDSNYDLLIESNHSKIGIMAATGTLASLASNRISYQFDFRGPSETLNTACSSGLVALSHAV